MTSDAMILAIFLLVGFATMFVGGTILACLIIISHINSKIKRIAKCFNFKNWREFEDILNMQEI
jgi:hypothetical protein